MSNYQRWFLGASGAIAVVVLLAAAFSEPDVTIKRDNGRSMGRSGTMPTKRTEQSVSSGDYVELSEDEEVENPSWRSPMYIGTPLGKPIRKTRPTEQTSKAPKPQRDTAQSDEVTKSEQREIARYLNERIGDPNWECVTLEASHWDDERGFYRVYARVRYITPLGGGTIEPIIFHFCNGQIDNVTRNAPLAFFPNTPEAKAHDDLISVLNDIYHNRLDGKPYATPERESTPVEPYRP